MVNFSIFLVLLMSTASTVFSAEPEEGADEEGYTLGTLTCILFGAKACDASCQTVAAIYGVDSNGTCDEVNSCYCDSPHTSSLDDLWSRKFEPKFVLPEIKRNKKLSGKVLEILQQPFKTAEETKEELKSILSITQRKKIAIKKFSPSATIPQPNDKFRHAAAEKFALDKLQNFIGADYPKGIDYKTLLIEALKSAEHEESFQHILHEVRRTHNPILGTIVDDYLKSNDEQEEPLSEKPENIIDFIDYVIINKLIDHIENPPKPKSKRPSRAPRVPNRFNRGFTSNYKPPPPRALANTPTLPQNLPIFQKTPSNSITMPPLPLFPVVNAATKVQWRIPGIDEEEIAMLAPIVDKTWWDHDGDYNIRYKQNLFKGEIELNWKKGDTDIYLHKFSDGFVYQLWKFGDLNAAISAQIVPWPLANHLQNQNGPQVVNNADEDAPRRIKEFITAWCDVNAFLFGGKELCQIM